MKKIIFVIFAMVISMPLWAEQPNWVECRDKRDTLKLVYTTTSRNGEPTFSYARLSDGPLSRKVEAVGDSIQSTDAVLGELISVKDGKFSDPDRSTEWVSLVLPHINLMKDPRNPDAKNPEVKFDTVVVETTSQTSFVGVPMVPGVIHQDSRYFDVKCTAKIALFEKPAESFGH